MLIPWYSLKASAFIFMTSALALAFSLIVKASASPLACLSTSGAKGSKLDSLGAGNKQDRDEANLDGLGLGVSLKNSAALVGFSLSAVTNQIGLRRSSILAVERRQGASRGKTVPGSQDGTSQQWLVS
jgi:hypothetical protein